MLPGWAWTLLSVVNGLIVAAAIVSVLRRPREPQAMLAWILALLFLPIAGVLLYVLIGQPRLLRTRRRRHRRRQRIAPTLEKRVAPLRDSHGEHRPGRIDAGLHDVVRLATRLTGCPPMRGNEVTVYHDAEKTFLALQLAIEAARSHVHFQYYIFQPDDTGRAVADLLIGKARSGVRCRVLLDAVGCWRLPGRFVRRLQSGGVAVAFYHPVIPWRGRWHVNFRNHRKIVVVDGDVGFCGSQNIGDEYLGRRRKFGPWRDTHLRIVGPAVQQLQEVFVEDWHFATDEDLVADEYFPPPRPVGPHVVQNIPTGPDGPADVLHQVLFAAVAAARRSIDFLTPYFVPDRAIILALQAAAHRGVRVRLLVPAASDHWFVLWAGRSYYPELAAAGVEVLEYDHGMLHSKSAVVDGAWAMVGSANMDARSFRLNFELTTLLYDPELAATLQEDFNLLSRRARRVAGGDGPAWGFRQSLALGVARLASPLL